MCGQGGLLGLFGSSGAKAPKVPDVQTPAPPAPQRKQDTGAIVAIGNDDESDLSSAAFKKQKGGSALGAFGKGGPIL